MNTRHRQILFLLLAALLLQTYVELDKARILFTADHVKSALLGIYESLKPGRDEFRVVRTGAYRSYTRTYAALPEGFIHSGVLLFYKAPRDVSARALSEAALKYTHFFRRYQLEQSLREFNALEGDTVKKGRLVLIPYALPFLLPDMKKTAKAPLVFSQGLYYTGSTAGSERITGLLDTYGGLGINTVVFDAKDVTGIVNYRSHSPAVLEYDTHRKRSIDDIDKLIRLLRERRMYTIARIALFRDHLLYLKKPELAIRSRRTGGPWNASSGELWCDPTNRYVQDYNLSIAAELADKGVDEIQFDYIRFPTHGNLDDASYAYHYGRMPHEAVISHFLQRAYTDLSRRHTRVSIDIFGVVAWGKEVDIRKTGQRIGMLAAWCDVISPMLYPSHFNDNFDGFENPGDNPYYFIYHGCRRVSGLARGRAVRPWLQAFRLRTTAYDERYIIEQMKAARDAGALGYLFWNASNNYEVVRSALSRPAEKRPAHNTPTGERTHEDK